MARFDRRFVSFSGGRNLGVEEDVPHHALETRKQHRILDPRSTETADHATTAVVTLDRPRLFNLYDAAMRDELVDTMRALVADDAVVRIELRGAGKAFCAGGDPGEFGTTRDTALAHLIRSSANAAPLLLAAAPKLHAFVHGAAVGAHGHRGAAVCLLDVLRKDGGEIGVGLPAALVFGYGMGRIGTDGRNGAPWRCGFADRSRWWCRSS